VHVTPVLEETFYILSKKNTVYKVKLSEKGLSLQKESNGNTKIEILKISDIVGCRCMRSTRSSPGSCACHPSAIRRNNLRIVDENTTEQDEKDDSAYLYIYAYVLKKCRVKSGQKRERMTIMLRFRSFDKYDDNMREAQKWRLAVKCLVKKRPVPRGILNSEDSHVMSKLCKYTPDHLQVYDVLCTDMGKRIILASLPNSELCGRDVMTLKVSSVNIQFQIKYNN